MRCPACGQWNKKNLPNCFKCGCVLHVEDESDNTRAYSGVGLPNRNPARQSQEGVVSLSRDELYDRRARGAQFIKSLRGESENDYPERGEITASGRLYVDADVPLPPSRTNRRQEAELERVRNRTRPIRKLERQDNTLGIRHGRTPRHFVKLLKWVAAVVAICGMVFLLYYGGRMAGLFGSEAESLIIPTATPILINDKPGHRITFIGNEGETLFIRELGKTYIFTGTELSIEVADEFFIPEKPTEEDTSIAVTLNSVKSSAHSQETMPEANFDVLVPVTPLELIKPSEARIETSMSLYGIELSVPDGTQVLIDGKDASDLINNKGRLLHNAKVESGDTVVSIWAQAAYCRPYSVDIVLHRPYQDIMLELSLNTPLSANSNKVKISGNVARGAKVTVDFPHEDLVVDHETETFSFTALPTRTGDNAILITASMEGKKDSVITHHLNYMPTLDVYSRKAWSLDYKTLVANLDSWSGRIFVFYATVESQLSESPPMYEVTISGSENKLVIEYSGTATELEAGRKYRFYADVAGSYKELPMLIVRYLFKE